MRTAYLFRHGDQDSTDAHQPAEGWTGGVWKSNAKLSKTGVATALAIAQTTLHGVHPNIVIASPMTRAQEMAAIIAKTLNGPNQVVESEAHLGQGASFEQWDEIFDGLTRLVDAPTTREMIVFNPAFMFAIATRAVAAIYKAIDKIPAGGSALLVSHNPHCDLVVATLTGALRSFLLPDEKTPINIGKGDGVKITYDGFGIFQSLKYLPAPKITTP